MPTKKRYKKAVLIIYRSENGRDGWAPVPPKDVPAWVRTPDNIARMVDGEQCMKADEGPSGSAWYRGVLPPDDLARIGAENAKRARRAEKVARVVH